MASPQNPWGYPQAQTPTQPNALQTGMAVGAAPAQNPWAHLQANPAYAVNPLNNAAFGTATPTTDSVGGIGSASGNAISSWGIPGWESLDTNPAYGDNPGSPISPQAVQNWLQPQGITLYNQPNGGGGTQYAMDANGGIVGMPFDYSNEDSNFWTGAQLAAGLAGAAAGGAFSGAEAGAGAGAGVSGYGGGGGFAEYAGFGEGLAGGGAAATGGGNGFTLSGEEMAASGDPGFGVQNTSWTPPQGSADTLYSSGQYNPSGFAGGSGSALGTTAPAAAAPAATGWEGLASFAGKNPGLVAGLAGSGLSALQGSPDMPSGGSGGNNTAQIDALKAYLYGGSGSGAAGVPDFSNLPGVPTGNSQQFYQNAADAMYSQQTRYLDPQMQQQQQALEARLSEQGFVPGTPGYKQAMQNFQDTSNRAYGAARDSSILQGVTAGQGTFNNTMATSREALAQYLAKRNQPLNEINALQTGDQIQYGRDLDRYNAEVGSQNSQNQMLGQLATALGIYYSDARLKEDITPIGQTPGGANLYTYTIFGRRETGVLAQELAQTQPDAVMLDSESGFLMVDYRKVR